MNDSTLATGQVRQDGEHVVQFYEDDVYLVDVVAPFLARGLNNGEQVIVLATGVHRAQLAAKLASLGGDVHAETRAGRITMRDAHDVIAEILVDGEPDWMRFHAVVGGLIDGGAPVCAFGELVNILTLSGRAPAAVKLEEMWNRLAKIHPISLLCGYHIDGFTQDADGGAFDAVCACHSHVHPTESWTQIPDESERRRQVTILQRRARALETEIARRRKLEASLRSESEMAARAKTDAESANRAKDEFLAMLGHELRNPLTPILTAVELLRMRGDSSREVDVIERQAGHIARLLELRRGRVEMWDVVHDGIETASTLLEQRRHVLTIEVPRRGCVVDGDRNRLSQVVSNLLSNAAKYSDPGTRIVVSVTREAGQIALRVRDHGIGIAPDMLDRIFDAFVQQPQAIDRAQGGLGLGLAIVRSLVQLHGGSVGVRSGGLGAGSEFAVTLPAASEERAVTSRPDLPAGARRIMVVDDNTDTAMLLAEALGSHGYLVEVAHDGPTALVLARELVPEVAVIDIGLPVMDGYELADHLRRDATTSGTKLIALTGYGRDTDREASYAAGFAEHVVKPVDVAAIREIVDRVLADPRYFAVR
jgi:signal transduction histidine kinase/ActR/RegA family two-component response regulator